MVIDREVFTTPNVSVGAFRCPVNHPSFHYTGPTEHYIVAFPGPVCGSVTPAPAPLWPTQGS